MSTAMNFGSKSFQPRPPDKGSFPLDHFGECKSFKEKFMKCLRENNSENALCRNESKEYLECRMERWKGLLLTCQEGSRIVHQRNLTELTCEGCGPAVSAFHLLRP
uniref:Cytochrome c oxidase assembly protein COX19 n=1 Tax=Rhinolophus ferrumequinum TaxID=59479 RepID=A0A671F1R5_RHIFE